MREFKIYASCTAVVVLSVAATAAFIGIGRPAKAKRIFTPENSGTLSVSATLDGGLEDNTWTSPVRGKLIVDAQASLINPRLREQHAWWLRVFTRGIDGERVMLGEQLYLHQPFVREIGKTIRPTFHEEWDVQPGVYQVEVGLAHFDAGGSVIRGVLRKGYVAGPADRPWGPHTAFTEIVR